MSASQADKFVYKRFVAEYESLKFTLADCAVAYVSAKDGRLGSADQCLAHLEVTARRFRELSVAMIKLIPEVTE